MKISLPKPDFRIAIALVLVCFGAISFELGRFAEKQALIGDRAEDVRVCASDNSANLAIVPNQKPLGQLVASKQGTYYYQTWCTGAMSIKEENRIYFASQAEAETAGYKQSSSCEY